LGEHAAPQADGNLVGLDFIVPGFAPRNRLHIERLAQHKGHPFLLTQVRQPLPGKPTLHADDELLFIGSTDTKKRDRSRREIFVDEVGALLIEKAALQRVRR